ncbi:MAG: hypothetical protein AB7K24_31265, partial [Gemmataceae bacterium]
MANEPISLLSYRIDPAGVATLLRKIAPHVDVVGPTHYWEKIIVSGKRRLFRKPPTLTFYHEPEIYEGKGWAKQRRDMQDYFDSFPDVPRKHKIIEA